MITHRLVALAILVAIASPATQVVVFNYNSTTGATTQTGNLVAGSSPTLVFRHVDGAWATGSAYVLAMKPDGRYDDQPFVLATSSDFLAAGRDLSVTVNLNSTQLYNYLGRTDARTVMLELADETGAYMVQHRVVVRNSVRRPSDTPPAQPAVNTYTDAQIDALLAALPAGMSPVASPIDGWAVESTAAGQLRTASMPIVHLVMIPTEYPETTTLATQDWLLVHSAAAGALRRVSLGTLTTWLTTQGE